MTDEATASSLREPEGKQCIQPDVWHPTFGLANVKGNHGRTLWLENSQRWSFSHENMLERVYFFILIRMSLEILLLSLTKFISWHSYWALIFMGGKDWIHRLEAKYHLVSCRDSVTSGCWWIICSCFVSMPKLHLQRDTSKPVTSLAIAVQRPLWSGFVACVPLLQVTPARLMYLLPWWVPGQWEPEKGMAILLWFSKPYCMIDWIQVLS